VPGAPIGVSVLRARTVALAVLGAALVVGASGAGADSPSPAASPGLLSWEKWQHLPGVFDLGLEGDGHGLIAQASVFFNVSRAGAMTPITGVDSYSQSGGIEAYFAVSRGEPRGGGCRFQNGAIYVIEPKTTRQILEVDARTGRQRPFATLDGVSSLNGIGFDGSGSFGDHPLLVTGPRSAGGGFEIAAIDCYGNVRVITTAAPRLEGGIAVAPTGFGAHRGELIVPDEISGDIIGVRPDGGASVIASYTASIGGDIGVESAGFVPRDFYTNGGAAYLSDRGTANNPHPGTDSILRLRSAQLAGAGVKEGDLLVATEGAGTTLLVTCAASCSARPLASGPPTAHIEGHLVFLNDQPSSVVATTPAPHRPRPGPTPKLTLLRNPYLAPALAGAGVVVLAVAVILLLRRRSRG
jgi:hypothetical protein